MKIKKIKLLEPMALGYRLREKLSVIFWRLRGCDHDTPAHINVGDEDHDFWYCYRCSRKTN